MLYLNVYTRKWCKKGSYFIGAPVAYVYSVEHGYILVARSAHTEAVGFALI